ncbi:MAG: murein biosynthesis integral membrane protein MurJ [Phototrophicaceae bacterium]|jgi:putative peptidoglycan lipid II flippase
MTAKTDLPRPTAVEPQTVPVAETTEQTHAGVALATGVVAAGNIASRVFGLAREIVLTNRFGAGAAVDAFNIAVIVPRAFYDLLIGGHVNSALVPVLSEAAAREGEKAFWQLVSVLFSFVTVVVSGLVLILVTFAPQVIEVVAGSDSPAVTLSLATRLLRLTAPALVFLSLFAVFSGTLYALRSFSYPAFAGAIFNAAIVVVTLIAARWIGITAAAWGWLIGSVAQFALQLPGLKLSHLRFTLQWNHPGLRQIARLYAPVMFSLIVDTLVIRLFSYRLANSVGEGSISYMTWATTLIQFPHGLVATAISIAILPTLSRQAAASLHDLSTRDGHITDFKNTLSLGLRLAMVLILPATFGLFALATPIIQVLFEHGAFKPHDTVMTAWALRLYLIGLPFATLDLLLVYAFYAWQDTVTPAIVGVLSLTTYMILAVILIPQYGLFSLMIADSAKHLIHACVSAYLLSRKINGLEIGRLGVTTLKGGIAALVMALIGAWLAGVLAVRFPSEAFLVEFGRLSLVGAVCLTVFGIGMYLLRVEELRWLFTLIRSRLKRG